MIDLRVEDIANGALEERLQEEIERAVANILDPNTDALKVRKVKLELAIKPNKDRSMCAITISTSSTLASPVPVSTDIFIGKDPRTGEIGVTEINPKQHVLPGMSEPKEPAKLVNFAR